MADYVLSCCSTADMTPEHFLARDLKYICFTYDLDGVTYPDDLGQTMPFETFYQAMADGADTKTSQINADRYAEYFEGFLKEGRDVLHLSLSSGISGSYHSACIAATELREKYPERKLYVVDTLAASSGYGLLMDRLADLRDAGMDIDALHEWAQENKLKMNHWVFCTDLTYLIRGGRISKASGFVGSMLNICPVINVNVEGKLIPRKKARGKVRAMNEVLAKMEELADDRLDYSGKCYICHSACQKDAQTLAKLVEEKFPKLNGPVEIYSIGTVIGSHTGPGTVSVFFWGDKREN